MRILLISEQTPIINTIEDFCNKKNYFLVIYRLPLKALDNIAEILPDTLIINAIDFQRHWKIVFHYLNCLYADFKIKKFLLIGANFSASDFKKAELLKVDGFLRFDEKDSVSALEKLNDSFIKA